MPINQPSNSTSTRTITRPTQGATLGSAIRPPRYGSITGPNFHAAQIARIQNVRDAASRTKPRSNPTKVEPNRTNKIRTSAPVKCPPLARHLGIAALPHDKGAFYPTWVVVAVIPASQIQDAGVTMVAA